MKKNIVLSVLMIAMLLVLAGCGGKATDTPSVSAPAESSQKNASQSGSEVTAEGRIVPRDSAWLSFNRSGKVAEVLVKEGDTVKAGQPLVRMGDREALDTAERSAELALLIAQQALDTLNRTSSIATGEAWQNLVAAQTASADAQKKLGEMDTRATQTKIDDALAKVQDAKTKVDDAQKEFDKYKDLDRNNTSRQNTETTLENEIKNYNTAVVDYTKAMNDLDILRADAAHAQAAEKEAQRKYDAGESGPDPDELALANARLAEAKAQLASAQATLANLELTAPYAGTVVQLDISAGEIVSPNQPVVQFADITNLYVETTDLTELKVVDVFVGMKVTIIPDALPDLELTGTVESIRNGYIEKSGDINYTVRIKLNKSDPRLKWGMTVSADFIP